ncbi:MAG: TPR repeat protein [Nitrospira sp.]|nr:MAG: TPR repeat protein [Nitrospira sp.]
MASSQGRGPSNSAEIDRLATAFAKDPRSKMFLPLAEAYIKADMWQEAAAVLEDGLSVYPNFVTAMAALGRVYDQLGQQAKAKAILEQVVTHSPDNLRAHRILAKLFHAEGQAESALRSCHAILVANPHDEEALSIKRSITGASDAVPKSTGKKSRATAESKPESVQETMPVATAPEQAAPTTVLSPEPVPEPPVMKHAATIARLEAWLCTIQTQRRADHDRL